jgi:carbamate kinase
LRCRFQAEPALLARPSAPLAGYARIDNFGMNVVALGGNTLMRPGERGTAAEQRANLREACEALRPLLAEGELVITHGNGPQVGNELLRHERGAEEVPPLPLYLAVAQTQAEIGALIESELEPVAGRPVACLLTHVVVDESDPAFEQPSKPVGPFYDEARALELQRERGWKVVHDAGRGWRRVVPSPAPLEVVELGAIRSLLRDGSIVVACGGGGIPATRRDGRLAGVDAVIDKDRASSLLARELDADRLVILTEVPAVYRAFGTDRQEELRELRAQDAEALLPELAAGSMRPKVEASLEFATATGHEALITSSSSLVAAIQGAAGTRITP